MLVVNPTGKHRRKRRHHGEGTVIERTDRWRREPWAAVVPYVDPSGRRREKWLSAGSRDEAEAKRREFLRDLRAGLSVEALDRSVDAHMTAWLEAQVGRLAPSTYHRYREDIDLRIVPSIGRLMLADVTPTVVRAAMTRWDGSPTTVGGTLRVLRAGMRQAVDDRLIPSDPTQGVKAPQRQPFTPVVLDMPEVHKLLDAAKGERHEALLITTLGLGLRRGEALGLRVTDIGPDYAYVRIEKSLRPIPAEYRSSEDGASRLVKPKADSGRAIPLPRFVADALRKRVDKRATELKRSKVVSRNAFVFCDERGNSIAFTSWARWFTAIVKKAKLPPMRPHDLRHSTATLLLAEGVPERVVQEILGHSSGEMTRRYMKALPRMTRDAADRLDRAMAR